MERRGHRATNSWKQSPKSPQDQAAPDFVITDEEVEQALNRLQTRVEAEAIPSFWQSASAMTNETEMPEQKNPEGLNPQGLRQQASELHTENAGTPTKRGKRRQLQGLQRRTRRRVAWTVAAAAILFVFLATPFGGKAMASAMRTFYFHNLVGVSGSDLNQIQRALQTSGVEHIDLKQYGSVEVTGASTSLQQNLSLAKASKLAGYSINTLPGFNPKRDVLNYAPGNQVVFRLNVKAINSLLVHLGGKVTFPDSVNQQPIVVEIPPQVFESVQNGKQQMSLSVRKVPVVQVPESVNMNQVRQALMDLPFLPSNILQSLATSSNWEDTLYVADGGKATNMTINGYSAVLQSQPGGQQYSVIWLENGKLYRLSGSPATFPTPASVIAAAKELSR